MFITLRNDFHNSTARVRVRALPATLSESQTARAKRQLCGNRDCACGNLRGPQWHDEHRLMIDVDSSGRWMIDYAYPEDVTP